MSCYHVRHESGAHLDPGEKRDYQKLDFWELFDFEECAQLFKEDIDQLNIVIRKKRRPPL